MKRLSTDPTPDTDLPVIEELIPLSECPSTAITYLVSGTSDAPRLTITLRFDTTRYIQGAETDAETATKTVADDLEKITRAHKQLSDDKVTVELNCGFGTCATALDKAVLTGYLAGAQSYLQKIAGDDMHTYGSEKEDELTAMFSSPLTWTATEACFQLETSILLKREDEPADEKTEDDQTTDEKTTDDPVVQVVRASFLQPETTTGDYGHRPYSFFARSFEQAFPTVRIAKDDADRLWAILYNGQGYAFSIDATRPAFYAPAPLLTNPLTADNVTLYDYIPGKGLDKERPQPQNVRNIDIDALAADFLSACDEVLSPTYLASAALIDKGLKTALVTDLDQARSCLAAAIAATLEDIRTNTVDPSYGSPAAGQQEEARETLRQQLLQRLGAAYELNAVVQLPVTVQAPEQDASAQLLGRFSIDDTDADDQAIAPALSRLPLKNGAGTLSFLSGTQQELATSYPLSLSFHPKAIEYAPDADTSFVLSFLEPRTVTIGAIEVPAPLRALPQPVSLKGQSVLADESTETNILRKLRRWEYGFTYARPTAHQDQVRIGLKPNINQPRQSNTDDLPQALLLFKRVWTPLSADLQTHAAAITSASSTEELTAARVPLETFSVLLQQGATAWRSWPQVRAQYVTPTQEDHTYTVFENHAATSEAPYEMTIRLSAADANATFPHPHVEGYVHQLKESTADQVTYRMVKADEPTTFLTVAEAAGIGERTLAYPGLDLLQPKGLRAGLSLLRNSSLFTGDDGFADTTRPTNSAFIYRTPSIYYATTIAHRIDHNEEINLSSFADGPLPVIDYLQLLFTHLFDGLPGDTTYPVRVACSYCSPLSEEPLSSSVPVFLAMNIDFRLPQDWSKEEGSCIQKMSEAIRAWIRQAQPVKPGAYFQLDLSVSTNEPGTAPALHFSDIRLYLDSLNED